MNKAKSGKAKVFDPRFRAGSKSARALVVVMERLSHGEWHDRHDLVASVSDQTALVRKTVSNLLHDLNGYGAVRRRGGYGMTRRPNGSLRQRGSKAPAQVAITPLGQACWDREAECFETDSVRHISPESVTGLNGKPSRKEQVSPAARRLPWGSTT